MSRLVAGVTAHTAAGSRSAFANDSCTSRSEATRRLQYFIGPRGLRGEHRKRGNVGVPFDQRRQWTEACEGEGIQVPDLCAYPRTVIIDEHAAVVGVPGEMDLLHDAARQAGNEGARIESEIARTDVYVIHVEQQPAATRLRDGGEKIPFGEMRV